MSEDVLVSKKELDAREDLQSRTSFLLGHTHGSIASIKDRCQCPATRKSLDTLFEHLNKEIAEIYYK
jgi:hypothetical protein